MRNNIIWSINEKTPENLPEYFSHAYNKTLPYIREFLTANHPFRKGVMCPFVPKAIKRGTIYFTYYQKADNTNANYTIDACIEKLNSGDNLDETAKATIILFEETFSITDLLKIHIENKVKCVSSSLMIGALYPASMATSLHSECFFPLRTPYPTLVLRNITPAYLIFLDPDHYSIEDRVIFLDAFIKRFSNSNIAKNKEQVLTAKNILEKYNLQKIT